MAKADSPMSALAFRLDASSSDEVKFWLQQVHAALEKQPARELFAKFSRDVTVCPLVVSPTVNACERVGPSKHLN